MLDWQDDVQDELEEMLFPRMVEQREGQVIVTLDKSNSRQDAEILANGVTESEWAPDHVAAMTMVVGVSGGEPERWGVVVDEEEKIEMERDAAETARQNINEALEESDLDLSSLKGEE